MRQAILILVFINLALSLEVSPGSFTVQLVPLGYPQDLGIPLVIQAEPNESVRVKILQGCPDNTCPQGYESLPDKLWYKIEAGEDFVANKKGIIETRMWTNLPPDKSLANRHFSVFLEISTHKKEVLSPVLMPVFFIETVPDTALAKIEFSVAPSIIEFDSKKSFGEVAIYNGDSKKHFYSIKVIPPEENSTSFPNLSYSYIPAREKALTVYPRSFSLQAYQSAKLTVRLLEISSQRKEVLVFVERDDGQKRFVRVKIAKKS